MWLEQTACLQKLWEGYIGVSPTQISEDLVLQNMRHIDVIVYEVVVDVLLC